MLACAAWAKTLIRSDTRLSRRDAVASAVVDLAETGGRDDLFGEEADDEDDDEEDDEDGEGPATGFNSRGTTETRRSVPAATRSTKGVDRTPSHGTASSTAGSRV